VLWGEAVCVCVSGEEVSERVCTVRMFGEGEREYSSYNTPAHVATVPRYNS
jgi:hypothetical protein